jgi:hypothetical protein
MQEMIEKGLSLVQEDAQHDLRAGFRCRLLSLFDEMSGGGRRERTKLATLSVEKVLPLWQSLFPRDQTPCQALDLVDRILAGAISTQIAQKEMRRLWTHCDNLAWRYTDRQHAVMVGYGAIQSVREALSEKHFGCEQVSDTTIDMDVDPYDHDSAFCAAIAYSGGPPWEKNSNSQKRLEFWTWWLTCAVCAAVSVGAPEAGDEGSD